MPEPLSHGHGQPRSRVGQWHGRCRWNVARCFTPDLRQSVWHLARSSTSGLRGLVIQARHRRAGIRRVHDRSITSLRQAHRPALPDPVPDRGHWEPLRHDIAAPAARLCRSSIRRQRRVPGQRLNSSLDAMGMVPIRQPAPAACTNKASPPPSASRTARNGTGRPGCPAHRQTSSPGVPIMGQNGRRSAKRAVIRTARSARTLSVICP